MKKRMKLAVLIICCLLTLTGCCFHKQWQEATCEVPRTCVECGKTEGEALGHSWVAATCETAKTCEVCQVTDGDPLGHQWMAATTEAPKACSVCSLTEGERIITDSRFTTASTKSLQGLWAADLTLSGQELRLDDYRIDSVQLRLLVDFRNDGTMDVFAQLPDEDAFLKELISSAVNAVYAEFSGFDISAEDIDPLFEAAYGMDVRSYLESTLGALSFNEILSAAYPGLNLGSVYYVEEGKLFTGPDWSEPMVEQPYSCIGDALILQHICAELARDVTFSRVTE